MRAFARIALYDKTGKKVFAISEGENSKKTSVMVGGIPVMKTEKILPMCESALQQLMKDLEKRLPKVIKKADKL
jgi:S-adenosylmethionine synthetase